LASTGAGLLRRLGIAADQGLLVLERNIRVNTVHGAVQTMGLNMVHPFIGIFAVRLGATNYQIALLSSAPAVVSLLAMVPGARFVDRFDRKKRLTMAFIFLHRLFFLALAMVPFFTPDRRAAILVALVALMNLPGAIGNVTWQSFIGGIVPAQLRPGAFAARNRAMSVFGTCIVLLAGRMLDVIAFPVGYQVAFVIAFLFAMAELWVLNQIDEEGAAAVAAQAAAAESAARPAGPAVATATSNIRRAWRELLSHRPYVRYTAASVFFYFAWQTAWPLFTLYQVRVLGANNMWVSMLSLANTGGSLVGYGFWARYATRHGNLRTLFTASAGIFIVPLVYAFSTSLYTVAAFNLLTGAIFSGVSLSLFNALLDTTPDRHRTSYIAYYNTLINISAIGAPMFGVTLLDWLGFRWAFLISAAMRVAGSLVFFVLDRMETRATAASQRHAAGRGATARGA
jgi:MFS family permease